MIKCFFLIQLLCLSLTAFSQTHDSTIPPVIFIDSVRMGNYIFMDPHKVADMKVVNYGYEESTKTKGRIYIKSKNHDDLNLLNLEQVASLFTKTNGPKLYMIDDKIIKDVQNTVIDSSYIFKCDIVDTKELPYLKNTPSLIVLNIITKSAENIRKANEIRIKGIEAGYFPESKL